jgi:ribosomal protein S18 acetylase RimI-like enzyme
MTRKLDAVYRLQKRDVPRAAIVLTDAFQHDPIWKVVLSDATATQKAGAFETPLLYCLKFGEVYATSENLEGIAAWVPGDLAAMTPWRILRSGAMRAALKLGWKVAKKMEPIFGPLDADRKEIMNGHSFIYLQIIGVAPTLQGRGFGGKLMRALIKESERAGLPLYLETETESNVRMYERLGFTVVKEIVLPIINLPMWEMVRDVSKKRPSEYQIKEQA